ncbi:hypothetical protein EMCRGX_G001558 [Ephydatia muelleri]
MATCNITVPTIGFTKPGTIEVTEVTQAEVTEAIEIAEAISAVEVIDTTSCATAHDELNWPSGRGPAGVPVNWPPVNYWLTSAGPVTPAGPVNWPQLVQ